MQEYIDRGTEEGGDAEIRNTDVLNPSSSPPSHTDPILRDGTSTWNRTVEDTRCTHSSGTSTQDVDQTLRNDGLICEGSQGGGSAGERT